MPLEMLFIALKSQDIFFAVPLSTSSQNMLTLVVILFAPLVISSYNPLLLGANTYSIAAADPDTNLYEVFIKYVNNYL